MPASYYKRLMLNEELTMNPVKLTMTEKLNRPYKVSKNAAIVLEVAVPS